MPGAEDLLRRLAAFAVFADQRNLTRAAAALHITRPSLHAKLATLARQIGRSH